MRSIAWFGLGAMQCLFVALGITACSSDDDAGTTGGSGGEGGAAPVGGAGGGGGDAGRGEPEAGPPPTEITEVQIDAGSFTFDARVAGPEDGEVVLLLHGFPQTSYEWRYLMPALAAEGYRAIAPNQRGYSPGARPPNIEDYVIPELVADVGAIADAVGAETFHVVGHDWGAAVAWAVAGMLPDRVDSVVPISVPHPDAFRVVLNDTNSCQYSASSYFDTFSQEGFENTLVENDAAALRGFYTGLGDDAAEDYVSVLGTADAMRAALNWYRANVRNRSISAPELGPTTVPTTYVWSDGDAALCRDGAELTADYVTGPYAFVVVEGVTHWVPEMAPEEVAIAVLERLASTR